MAMEEQHCLKSNYNEPIRGIPSERQRKQQYIDFRIIGDLTITCETYFKRGIQIFYITTPLKE
jgi:hypothetical protein